ncbi:hypothetical protein C8E86_3026 [Catellatospora citrea]|nr:hypothetical protein C8E86_3026 [Catellatospora citrea]
MLSARISWGRLLRGLAIACLALVPMWAARAFLDQVPWSEVGAVGVAALACGLLGQALFVSGYRASRGR